MVYQGNAGSQFLFEMQETGIKTILCINLFNFQCLFFKIIECIQKKNKIKIIECAIMEEWQSLGFHIGLDKPSAGEGIYG